MLGQQNYVTSVDEFLSEYFDFDQETMQFYDHKSTLESIGIQLKVLVYNSIENRRIIIRITTATD